MNYPNEKEFTPRLEWVLADRKITPWAKKLGLSSGTAARLLSNVVPGTDILTAIMRTEHVNLNWLLEGKGSPFMLDGYSDEGALLNMLAIHAQDARYTAYVYTDIISEMAAIVLTQPATYEFKNKQISYNQVETLFGPCESTRSLLSALNGCNIQHFTMTQLDLNAFSRGQFGTYKLLGDEKHKGLVLQNVALQETMTIDHHVPKQKFSLSTDDRLKLLNLIITHAEKHHVADKLDKIKKLEVVETLEEMQKPVSQITPTEIEFALRASVH